MSSDIFKLYNLNIIDLNVLVEKKINIDINNFLIENNLIDLPDDSKDRKKIYNHFIASNLLEVLNENYNNIFTFNIKTECIYYSILLKIIKTFKLNFIEIDFNLNEIEISVNKNILYKFKQLAESKKKVNYSKINDFCIKNSLTSLSQKIKTNIKTKMLLHK